MNLNNRIMTPDQRAVNRAQLAKCFFDLANRAKELDEPALHALSLVVAASITEKADDLLALWVAEFARARIEMIQDQINENKKDDDEF